MHSTEVAIVTGAGGMRSIGRAVAVRLAQDGYDVVISDFQRPDDRVGDDERAANWAGLASVADEIAQLGRRALPVFCDLANASDVEYLIGRAVDEFGRVDVLANTARAFTYPEQVEVINLAVEAWDHVNAVNVRGPMLTCRAAARTMIETGIKGRIVNVSSLASHKPTAGSAPYCCSKAALDMLTRVLALELGPHGIRINAVNPGTIATNRVSIQERETAAREGIELTEFRRQQLANAAAANPLRRVGQPDDVADVVAFLVADGSRHISGQCIDIAGGPA
ncbi:MAG TPA: SDR family NAD(P)-dependent oxidoreductase [Acidimicrobiales bacterium]|nr:SDR family NAD(P)-dependent oxidoreductase [Acidimicrobiales bacterium]